LFLGLLRRKSILWFFETLFNLLCNNLKLWDLIFEINYGGFWFYLVGLGLNKKLRGWLLVFSKKYNK
jgi:hypothetical protein